MVRPRSDDETVSPQAKMMRVYRASPKGAAYAERARKMAAARARAITALMRKFPAEYTELYESELRTAGLWPLRTAGRPRDDV